MEKLAKVLCANRFEASASEYEVHCLTTPETKGEDRERLRFALATHLRRMATVLEGEDPQFGPILKVSGVSDDDLMPCPDCGGPMTFGQVASDYGDWICRKGC